jgi:hypothetical protein
VSGFGTPSISAGGTSWQWSTLSSFSDVVLVRNDSVAQTASGVPGYGWTFDGGPFDGGIAHVETDRFGNVLYTITRQQYVRAYIYAIRAADALDLFPWNVVPSQDSCSGRKCWFIGGAVSVLYVTNSSSRPRLYELDSLYRQHVGIEAVRFAFNPSQFSSQSGSFFALRDTQSNCDPVLRFPSLFTGTSRMTGRLSVVSVGAALPKQYFAPGVDHWDRTYQQNTGGIQEIAGGVFTWAA